MSEMRFPAEFPGLHVDLGGQVLHWVFPFYRRGDKLLPEDQGGQINRSVWVFRVNC